MKIAMLSTFYPYRGGIAQFNANLYEELKEEHEVIPYTFTRQYPVFLFPGKTQYVTPNDNAIPINSIPILDTACPYSYGKAAQRIINDQPDLLILRYWMSYLAPSLGTVARKARKKGIKVVTIVDNAIPHEPKFFDKSFTKWFLKQNDGIVTLSQAVQNDVLTLCPNLPTLMKPHPLYNHFGSRIETRKAREMLGLDPDKKTLLFFGIIRDYKGLDLLIEAFNQLDDSYQLIIAGETYGSFDKYQELIDLSRDPQHITVFNRYIDDGEVPLFFSAADVCVLPYRSATQSGITSIAYHFETPLIATPVGGLSESIEDQGVGLMTSDISSEAIAESICKFYTQDKCLFNAGFKKEKRLLSWDAFAKSLIDFSKEL